MRPLLLSMLLSLLSPLNSACAQDAALGTSQIVGIERGSHSCGDQLLLLTFWSHNKQKLWRTYFPLASPDAALVVSLATGAMLYGSTASVGWNEYVDEQGIGTGELHEQSFTCPDDRGVNRTYFRLTELTLNPPNYVTQARQ